VTKPALTGNYFVTRTRAALSAARRLIPKTSDCMELRDHVLKLRYWPTGGAAGDAGQLVDLNWSWVKSLPGSHIGELRVDDAIAGCDNLRVIFFVAGKRPQDPMPRIWIFHVMQKKQMDFSPHMLTLFKARKDLVIEDFYS
jgi:hypothetical protein